MTLESIRLKTVDESARYRYRNRTLEFKVAGTNFETPTRAATLYEFNQKKQVPTDVRFTNPVSVSVQRLNAKNVIAFLSENEVPAQISNRVRTAETSHMGYSPLRIHVVQPTTGLFRDLKTHEKGESGVDWLKSNNTQRETFIRMLFNLQLRLGLEQITLPYLGLDRPTYLKTVKQFASDCRAEKREPVVAIDLDYGNRVQLEGLIRSFMRECQIRLFAFPYKSWSEHITSYDVLSEFAEEDIAFFSFDTPRFDSAHFDISTTHCLPFMASDIFSVLAPRPPVELPPDSKGGKGEGRTPPPARPDSVRFFNPQNLAVERASNRVIDGERLLREMDEPSNQRLLEMIGDFGSVGEDPEKLGRFKMLSKVHELKSSSKEMERFQKRIDEGSSSDYVKEKAFLAGTLNETIGRNRQSRL